MKLPVIKAPIPTENNRFYRPPNSLKHPSSLCPRNKFVKSAIHPLEPYKSQGVTKMAQAPSIEDPERVFFITAKTQLAKLWFINNPVLEQRILAHLAKYQDDYGAIIHGFVIMGNHYHLLARFPNSNKADFKRDFHSMIARLTKSHVELFEGGKLWGGRSLDLPCPNKEDILNWFFYLTLNPIYSGLTQRISEYPGYNSFHEAVQDIKNEYKIVDREGYNAARARGRKVAIQDYTTFYTLKYTRLPGYEDMHKRDYVKFMHAELATRAAVAVELRLAEGKGFLGRRGIKAQTPGSVPENTKRRARGEKTRPIVLTLCEETRRAFKEWYFQMLEAYKEASRRFRDGELEVEFPPGTYRPRLAKPCLSC